MTDVSASEGLEALFAKGLSREKKSKRQKKGSTESVDRMGHVRTILLAPSRELASQCKLGQQIGNIEATLNDVEI